MHRGHRARSSALKHQIGAALRGAPRRRRPRHRDLQGDPRRSIRRTSPALKALERLYEKTGDMEALPRRARAAARRHRHRRGAHLALRAHGGGVGGAVPQARARVGGAGEDPPHRRSARADAADARAALSAGAPLGRAGRDAAAAHQRRQRRRRCASICTRRWARSTRRSCATSIAPSRRTTTSSSFDGDNNARARRAGRASTRRSRTGIAPSTRCVAAGRAHRRPGDTRRAAPPHRPHLRGAAAAIRTPPRRATSRRCRSIRRYVPAMQSLTALYQKRGDWLKAAQMMVRAEAVTRPTRSRRRGCCFEAGRIYREKLDDELQAGELFARVLELDPEHVEAGEPLAEIYFRDEKWAELEPILDMLARKARQEGQHGAQPALLPAGAHGRRAGQRRQGAQVLQARLRSRLDVPADAARPRGPALQAWRTGTAPSRSTRRSWSTTATRRKSRRSSTSSTGSATSSSSRASARRRSTCSRRRSRSRPTHRADAAGGHRPAAAGERLGGGHPRQAALLSIAEEPEQVKLLDEIGDIYHRTAQQPAEGDHRVPRGARGRGRTITSVLHKVLDLYSETKQWKKAVEIIDAHRRPREGSDPPRQVLPRRGPHSARRGQVASTTRSTTSTRRSISTSRRRRRSPRPTSPSTSRRSRRSTRSAPARRTGRRRSATTARCSSACRPSGHDNDQGRAVARARRDLPSRLKEFNAAIAGLRGGVEARSAQRRAPRDPRRAVRDGRAGLLAEGRRTST